MQTRKFYRQTAHPRFPYQKTVFLSKACQSERLATEYWLTAEKMEVELFKKINIKRGENKRGNIMKSIINYCKNNNLEYYQSTYPILFDLSVGLGKRIYYFKFGEIGKLFSEATEVFRDFCSNSVDYNFVAIFGFTDFETNINKMIEGD